MKLPPSSSSSDAWLESQSRLKAIIESTDDAIIGKTLDGIITDWNPGAERMFGYKAAEIVGRHVGILFPLECIEEEKEIIARLAKGERIPHFETLRLRKNGERFQVSATISPIISDQGKVIGASKILRDVTEQNRAIEDLKRAGEQIADQAALIDKARDAILVRSLEGEVLFWNHGAERMYGWSRQEAMGKKITELLYRDSAAFEDATALVIGRGEWSGEMTQYTKEGKCLTIEASWSLLRDKEGNPKSVLAINTDVTERKKIEDQFMRAQRMESIGTLAGGIAHDLNNVLSPIMMSIGVLKMTVDNPKALQMLETIGASARRGAEMVRQVLSFARGVEGRQIKVQIGHILRDIEYIVKDTFPKNVKLRLFVPADVWLIVGDPTQLHQVLLNFSVNARDAMPNGGVLSIAVENHHLDSQYLALHPLAKPGPYVVIGVSDTGTGIPQEIIDKIFDPFFTTKEIGKGTGLGLSTVMAIVKGHRGFLNVYSEPGKGTTFKVYLPAEAVSVEAANAIAEVELPRGEGETILVVDDEASIREITAETLTAFGYHVLTAEDGAAAIALYAQHSKQIAVVLTDMMMPVMDGPALIHAMMKINPAVKIIAASGLNANGNTAKAAGAGVEHFLSKPYTAETLLATLRDLLE
ncbi:PAS/PAC sensor hybrid histidine kinase [Verrucomicrobium sp. GAS474]|uniref:PAS domain-containing hybrid sensor histidine kinase/response regulator n=1 Tax=Verrucomicrobium sp. GAS474 TaxID=1882831 RepID=UPI00087B6825|nr:PAS domain-containing sensor histidine kinase [Verrucomicrobium sp. GAS474]SDU20449.1 PAS/PAC sensor hybrid histidine kinase [Verrucomicrobium sp. GAS474]